MKRPPIEEILARCAAATPGPWEVAPFCRGWQTYFAVQNARRVEYATVHLRPDAKFIAHARTDLPTVCEYVYELERECNDLDDDARLGRAAWEIEKRVFDLEAENEALQERVSEVEELHNDQVSMRIELENRHARTLMKLAEIGTERNRLQEENERLRARCFATALEEGEVNDNAPEEVE